MAKVKVFYRVNGKRHRELLWQRSYLVYIYRGERERERDAVTEREKQKRESERLWQKS